MNWLLERMEPSKNQSLPDSVPMDKLRLLVIEDDPDQRDLIQGTLEAKFGDGTVVAVGTRAEALQQPLDSFNLILSDFNLPDATGMELLQQIQERSRTPVIMVTGENVGRIASEAISKGATDYVVKFGDYLFTIPLVVEKNLAVARIRRENERLRTELQSALNEVREKNAQLVQSLMKIEEVAATDPLTGLYNRRHFGQVLEQLFSEAVRYTSDLSCVMIDLDGYKQLNDTHGHQLGDQILVVAGKVIASNLRKMDVAARYGGDEFILLLPRTGMDDAICVAQRIREEFGLTSGALLRRNQGVGMSIGVSSMMNDHPPSTDQLVSTADAALYRAKTAGRNRVIRSDPHAVAG